jgi:DNA-binding NtrC family response regulator
MEKLPRIFIVEDDVFYANLLKKEIVKNEIGNVEVFQSGESFLDNLFKMPDIVLLDHNLDTMVGTDILKNIKSVNPNIHVILISAQEKLQVAVTSLKYGAYDYVEKNDYAFSRIKALIKRITKFNKIVDEEKQTKRLRWAVLIAVGIIVSLVLYLQL